MTNDDDVMTRLLTAAAARDALPDELEQQWRARFSDAMAPVIRRRRARRRQLGVAVAAGLAAVGLLLVKVIAPPVPPQVVAAVSSSTSAQVEPGTRLVTGQSIDSADGRVTLRHSGAEVRVDVATRIRVDVGRLTLLHGSLYVDTGPVGVSGGSLRVETSLGTITHVGTQFIVTRDDASLTVAVREGRVNVQQKSISRDAGADETSAGVVEIRGDSIQTRRIPRYGGPWQWVTQNTAAPESLEGRSVVVFLAWYARETGRTVRYTDAEIETDAAATLLHGISGVPIAQALTAVSAITRLRIEASASDDTILVASELDQHAD